MLPKGQEEDEVGYRLDGWEDSDRGRLIQYLNDLQIHHRFELDELVVVAEDEARVDDLLAEMQGTDSEEQAEEQDGARGDVDCEPAATGPSATGPSATGPSATGEPEGDLESEAWSELDEQLKASLNLLLSAARRLSADPTDMHADGDVAEASAAVFTVADPPGLEEDTWASIGRVTRRLLGALGSDEALEDEIRTQASVLTALLEPLFAPRQAPATAEEGAKSLADGTVYELAEWLPEQRAQLGVLLDRSGIAFEWDADDLVVPNDREAEVEALFGQVSGIEPDEDFDGSDEERYHTLEELFAASGRLASDPTDEERAADVLECVHNALGPAPLGLGEVEWLRIAGNARGLAESIRAGEPVSVVADKAAELRELLRAIV